MFLRKMILMEQIELNKLLYDECSKKNLDLDKIDGLLIEGADPLGIFNKYGEFVYNELIISAIEDDYKNLYEITKKFLDSGMLIKESVLKDKYGDKSINPFWVFAFKCDEEAMMTLKLLLDNDLDVASIEILADHIYIDYIFLEDDFDNLKDNKDAFISFEYAMKMIMLCVSYSHVIDDSDFIKDLIEYDNNNYDISKFRNFKTYYIEIEVKSEEKIIIIFKDNITNEVIWKMENLK